MAHKENPKARQNPKNGLWVRVRPLDRSAEESHEAGKPLRIPDPRQPGAYFQTDKPFFLKRGALEKAGVLPLLPPPETDLPGGGVAGGRWSSLEILPVDQIPTPDRTATPSNDEAA